MRGALLCGLSNYCPRVATNATRRWLIGDAARLVVVAVFLLCVFGCETEYDRQVPHVGSSAQAIHEPSTSDRPDIRPAGVAFREVASPETTPHRREGFTQLSGEEAGASRGFDESREAEASTTAGPAGPVVELQPYPLGSTDRGAESPPREERPPAAPARAPSRSPSRGYPIQLSAGVALPQTLPTGTAMGFSVDYRWVEGAPNPAETYFWVIEPAGGPPIRQPVRLQREGTLTAFAFEFRPEHGPFHTYIVDAHGRPLSPRTPLR